MLNTKILVTGAKGFIGKNLCVKLDELGYTDVVQVDKETDQQQLAEHLHHAEFIFHLAGVNRPENESEFKQGNSDLTRFIVNELEKAGKNTPIMISSSTQAVLDNAYGQSKVDAECAVRNYGEKNGVDYYIYRFPNVFGKWCRPNYNSFIATFCHNIINDIDININDPQAKVTLVYIDDICKELISLITDNHETGINFVQPEYSTTVGEVAELLRNFKSSRENLISENVGNGFIRALYSTYLSYFSPEHFSYTVPSHGDERGVFCEMLKTKNAGQFSFFTAHPGITRGGHYHHTKNEKFLVIKGKALYKFEHIITGERYELFAEDSEYRIIETVPGWTHDITNVGDDELIVMLWANEVFDRDEPDTIARPL